MLAQPAQLAQTLQSCFFPAHITLLSSNFIFMAGREQPLLTSNQDADEIASKVIRAIKQHLTEIQSTTKAPIGLDKALQSVDEVSRAFLKAGFRVWFAYFLANSSLQQSAAQLPSSTLQHVVTEVSKIKSHDSLDKRIRQILSCDRGARRRRESIKLELHH